MTIPHIDGLGKGLAAFLKYGAVDELLPGPAEVPRAAVDGLIEAGSVSRAMTLVRREAGLNLTRGPAAFADEDRRLLDTADALLVCWLCSLPSQGELGEMRTDALQASMQGLCEILDEAAEALHGARGLAREAALLARSAHGTAHCIEGALSAFNAGDVPQRLTVPDLILSARHVQRMVRRASEALSAVAGRQATPELDAKCRLRAAPPGSR